MLEKHIVSKHRAKGDSITARYSAYSYGDLFGFACLACASFWKIYQNQYHHKDCTRTIRKLRRGPRYWVNFIGQGAWYFKTGKHRDDYHGGFCSFIRMKGNNYAYMKDENGRSVLASIVSKNEIITGLNGLGYIEK